MNAWLFISLFLLSFGLVNYYAYIRGLQALGGSKYIRIGYIVAFWSLAVSYLLGTTMKQVLPGPISIAFVWAGSFWLGALLYFVLFALLFDAIRMVNKVMPVIPKKLLSDYPRLKKNLLSGVIIFVVLLLSAGYFNAKSPVVRNLAITLPYNGTAPDNLSVLVISDIHMGSKIGINRLNRMVELANKQDADIILLAGDIIDEDIEFLKRKGMAATLQGLEASYGVFGVMGNHEYISTGEEAYSFLTANGVNMLRDTAVKVLDNFYLIGREDFQKRTFAGAERKSIEELMDLTTDGYPVVVLDHQPFHPQLAASAGAHLMISGHTHHGQLWPLNFVTRAIYTLSFGHKVVEGMHLVVSNGIGTWGPPVRIGNRPEMVLIDLGFESVI